MKQTILFILAIFFISTEVNAQFSVTPQNAICAGSCTGSATITPPGNYYFNWSSGDSGQVVVGLCAGSYNVQVYDSLFNRIDSISFVILQPPPIFVASQTTNASCNGSSDGSIVFIASGGTAPYTYNWSNGIFGPSSANNLAAGNYAVTVTDANGCSASAMAMVNQPVQLAISNTVTNASSCSACDGSAIITVTGGVGAYTYAWSNGFTVANPGGLCQGTYTLTLLDANACSVTDNIVVNGTSDGLTASITSTGIHCNDVDTTVVTPSLGVGPYRVDWGDGATSGWGNSSFHHIYALPGSYAINIYDTAGCSYSTFEQVQNFGIAVSFTQIIEPSCSSPNNGSLHAAVIHGAPPYFYLWNTASITDSSANLTSGTYSVTVTDSLACSASQTITLSNTNNFYAYAIGNAASCDSSGLGSATIYASGGIGPYTYLWSTVPAQTTLTATGIQPGNYSFTVTDNGGCSVTNTANITFTSYSYYLYIYVDSVPNCGLNNGVLSVQPYYGASPFTYHWNDNQATQVADNLAAGIHSVTVTDAGGCTATASVYLQAACFNTITGNVFNDQNGNCLPDSGDTPVNWASVYASNGVHTYYGYGDNTGNYSIQVDDTGTFTVQANLYSYQTCGTIIPCGNSNLPVTFAGYNHTAGNINFGYTGSSGFDFFLHPGWFPANPGFNKDYWIFYGNQSGPAYTGNATVTFVYDPNLTYLSSDPPLPAHNVATHTLTWVVNGVSNWDRRGNIHFNVPASLPAGYLVQSDFYITPYTGDCDTSNNHMHFSELLTSSRDPNEKEVSPAGNIYDEDTVFTYTIRFQNTGTDTTWFIIVKDTLSHNLDPTTVRNLASSHPYSSFNISGEGILTWIFNPIFLVDSATNVNASKGFVMFSIKKKGTLPIGSTISNRASIYFDYNEPVMTNTVADTVADPNYIFEVHGDGNVSVAAFPNPFSKSTNIIVNGLNSKFDFTLYDVTGNQLKAITSIESKQFEVKRDDLSAGVYFYKIATGKQQVAYGKLVVE